MNRQQFVPGAKSSLPNKELPLPSLRIDPVHKTAQPFSGGRSSKQPTSIVPKSMAKTKTTRNSPDPVSTSTTGCTSVGQPTHMNKKRSIERTPFPNTVPKKKMKSSSGRRLSKTLETNGNQSDDQGYGSDIKLTQHSLPPMRIDIVKDDLLVSSKDTASVESSRKHSRQGVAPIDQQNTPIFIGRNQDHQTNSTLVQSFETPANHRNRTAHVRFEEGNLKTVVVLTSESEGQQSPSSNSSFGGGESLNEIVEDMAEDDTNEIVPFGLRNHDQKTEKVLN